nr:platelet glycoprotein Ib alpha chain-like [Ipomoea batatas]
MANTVVEFAEVMAEIGNTWTGGGIIKKTFENIDGMINVVSCSQPPQQQGPLDDDDIFNQQSFLDAVKIDIPAAMEQQHQDQFNANELQNIARDLEQDSEKTISDGEQLDTTPSDNTMKEFFDSEELFEYAGYYLNRDTFQSMRAGELENVLLQLDSPSNWGRDDNPEHSSNQIDFEQCLDTEINNVGKLDISDAQL